MQDRIKQLAIQADLYVDVKGEPWPRNMNGENIEGAYQKFAELIVKECILTIQMGITRDGHNTEKYQRSIKHLTDIKKHFGVKE